MSRAWPSSPDSSLKFCWDKVNIFQLCIHNLLPNKWGENLNAFLLAGKRQTCRAGIWQLIFEIFNLKGSSFWFIIFICINVHSYWLGIWRNFFVIYFVALCSSSLWYRSRFDLQIFQHVLTQYFGFYVIMEVPLINHNWFMHQWNTYFYIYI